MNLRQLEFSSAIAAPGIELVGAHAGAQDSPALVRRLLQETDEQLSLLRGVDSTEGMVVLGDAAVLPWVDGLIYLRACVGEPRVWLPTTTAISIPENLFARALLTAHPELHGPLVALPDPRRLISLQDARPLTRAHLGDWQPS